MEKMEKVEALRNKAGVSYEDAKVALEANDWDVLDAMSYGMSQKEIASLLGTSIRTIRRIQNKLLIKTGLDNLKQLGIYSVAENWMSLDE